MQGQSVVASPVLVGRDELLALAGRRIEEAAAGGGRLLFVAGEAGIGKTRLLGSIARRAGARGFAVVRGASFPDDAEVSGAALLDLASDLKRSSEVGLQGVGQRLTAALRKPSAVDMDPHRRRRLLVQELADAILDLGQGPQLIVLEDLHWADPLSLEVLGHLASRLVAQPTLVVGAYRSDELYPRTAMRELRARLLSQRLAEEIRLPRLTASQTETLTSAILGRPVHAQIASALHDLSDGIPLHVEELIAAAGETVDAPDPGTGVSALRFPDTLAEAVLSRAAALDAMTRDVAAAAAVIGRSFDFDLVCAVTEHDPEDVDRCLRLLQSVYLVEAGADAVSFDFRHALIRDALYADVPLPRRRQLHERVASVAVVRGYRDAFISAHFDLAALPEAAYRHAVTGARQAVDLSAHREALLLYRRALRNLPPGATPDEHATLLAAVGGEAAAADENALSFEMYTSAQQLWTNVGDALSAAAVVPPLVAVCHLLGEGLVARVRRLEAALQSIDGLADAEPVKAQLLGAISAAYMLDRRLDEAISYQEQARAVRSGPGDERAELHTAVTMGSVLVFAGRMDEGWALLQDSVSRAADRYEEAEAARAYRMIASSASVLVEYERAEQWLPEGIAYAESVELWNHRSYLAAHLAHVRWATGDWASAEATAQHALADGRGGITTLITAQYVLGYLALGRGDWEQATALLGEAHRLGSGMGELQRISPPLWGLAETCLLRGDAAGAAALCEEGYAASAEVDDAAYVFPFLVTGIRALLALSATADAEAWSDRVESLLRHRSIPGTLPAIAHARGLLQLAQRDHANARASLETARDAWSGRRRFWEGTWVLLDLAECAQRSRRDTEGAALVAAARQRAASAGAATIVAAADAVPVGRRRGPAKPWHPLTDREFSVATLVAAGLTNRQIATELVVSPKTVNAHVEHILTKLGVGRRAEIAAWAAKIDH